VIEHTGEYCTFYVKAPKGTTNYEFWAEGVINKAAELDIPALAVRVPDQAQLAREHNPTNEESVL